MKNYPLNSFTEKYINWTDTYLKELNAKIFALRNYSEFFLTDFIHAEVDLTDSVYIKELEKTIPILKLETLNFHNYTAVPRESYMETDATDANALILTQVDTQGNESPIYLRHIPPGTTIISNARPEGSIDANGVSQYNLWIEDITPQDEDGELTINVANVEQEIGFELPTYGPPHPDRTNWRNFVIQPTGYASLYSVEPIDRGLKFVFYEHGEEDYGSSLDLIFLLENARYNYLGDASSRSISSSKYGVSFLAKTAENSITIGTNTYLDDPTVVALVPWLSRSNPLMHFAYLGRDREGNTLQYGEEIIFDSIWSVGTTKLVTVNTLVYNVDIENERDVPPSAIAFDIEVL